MSKHRNRSLDVIDGIDEALIDNATKARIRYFKTQKRPMRARTAIVAIAAVVALLISLAAFWIVPSVSKAVPVYKGMTVTSSVSTLNKGGVAPLSAFEMLTETSGAENMEMNSIEDMLETEGIGIKPAEKLYYAKPGETIKITIHFDNPDQYEILSFTLNGNKYGSHMFLEGSNMEELTVNYTIDENAEALTECTIDAIKYVDGETIKDVKIGGDKTVKIGVYTENQPAVSIDNSVYEGSKMSFDVKVSDTLGLVEYSKGKILSVLADRDQILQSSELALGEKVTVSYEGLDSGKYYRYAIVAVYDAFDGKGVALHTLYHGEINRYSITYDLDGGNNPENNPEYYTVEEKILISDPHKNGYMFLGWTYGGVTEPVKNPEIPMGSHGNIEFKAHWRKMTVKTVVGDGTGDVIYEFAKDFQLLSPYDGDNWVHLGVDVSANFGDPVYAADDGEIFKMWTDEFTGFTIAIRHENGYETYYRCVDKASLPDGITVGAKVKCGQLIGTVGEPSPSGREKGIYHIHFEVLYNGNVVDPNEFFEDSEN